MDYKDSVNSLKKNRIELLCDDNSKKHIQIHIEGIGNKIIIEEMVEVSDCLTIHIVDNNSLVHIKRGTTFEETSISIADSYNSVTIGEDCMFARKTAIITSDFHSIIDLSTGKRKNISKKVEIDNHVWIGYGALILKNTHIFSNSIISANAVVCKNVYANSVYINSNYQSTNNQNMTWTRDRNCSIQALQLYSVNRNIIDSIQYKEDLLISIENNISDYFNKIKGWVILPDKDSTLTEAYVCCYFKKNDIEKNFIIPLFLHVREDVASYTKNKQYEHCGFETYMPAKIINNWNYINKVEIIIQNGEICVKKTILRK